MADIGAALVKSLRDMTGAGMMDCKRALIDTDGDIEEAVDWLRTKGLAAAAKKAGRVASEGLVGVATAGAKGAIVEINAETDFVARNEKFQEFVLAVAGLAVDADGDLAVLSAMPFPGGNGNVVDRATELVATIGENVQLRRCAGLSVGEGVVASYIHSATAPNLGRIAVLVAIESTGDSARLLALGKQLAMHVAASRPATVDRADLDAAAIDRERAVLAEQARAEGKPEEIVEKMVEGRLRKYYEEVVLLEQTFVIDGETKISEVLEKTAADLGVAVRVGGFVSYTLGEGIEKEATDFAAEVAAQVAG